MSGDFGFAVPAKEQRSACVLRHRFIARFNNVPDSNGESATRDCQCERVSK